ncbi:MAG: DNA translocase FtsK 4TM domain-containing protein, partial [Planctomycetes bacterium]|nr:DNA translocase FtsK 4TM domain-containing protein [Planctomycetota bacterium]
MKKLRNARIVSGVLLIGLGLFLVVSVLSYNPHEGPMPDYPPAERIHNICGTAGAYVSEYAVML